MKNVLVSVDDSKGSKKAVQALINLYSFTRPDKVTLLFVEKIEGRSLMDEMLGENEIETLKEMLAGTEYQEKLDKRAEAVLSHYGAMLKEGGIESFEMILKEGHPAEKILEAAKESGAELIIVGSRGRRAHSILMGSISREVANKAEISVLIAK